MTAPLISVIMTAYNCSKFLEESLVSLQNQTFKDFEIVFYDDGSTDDTYDKARYILNKIRTCHIMTGSNINYGVGFGRNRAIELASGKYLAIQDGDDISLPDRLEKEINCFNLNADLFCVGSGIIKIKENGEEINKSLQPNLNKDIIKKMISGINPIFDPSCMFKKDVFFNLNKYSTEEEKRYIPDWDLWIRAVLNNYKFCNLQEHLVKYRVHSNSNCVKYINKVFKQHSIAHNKSQDELIKRGKIIDNIE